MPTHKPFDPDLHNDNDPLGREAVKRYQRTRNRHAIDNPNPYGVDLLIYENDELIFYTEVEVRTCWTNHTFPYPTIHIPERQTKLLTNDKPTLYAVIKPTGTHMLVCSADTILNAPRHEIPNRYLPNNEYFYDVPLDQMRLIHIPPTHPDTLF